MEKNVPFHQKSMKILFAVSSYWIVSISMVFLNKRLLSADTKGNGFPLFVTAFQCLVAVLFCMRNASSFNITTALKVLPLSFVFVGMITFNNLTLQFLGIAFYNVGRSLTTICNVVLSYAILGISTPRMALVACGAIVFGFLYAISEEKTGYKDLEENRLLVGVVCGICASTCTALNAIFIKKSLPHVENDMLKLTFYNNLNACVLFSLLIVYFNETEVLLSSPVIYEIRFWASMMLAGIFGILIGIVSVNQIRATSPLTHNISGTAKACAQTILALKISGEQKSFGWWFSNVLVLGGSLGYAHVKREAMRAANALKKK
eukprot:g4505.t1